CAQGNCKGAVSCFKADGTNRDCSAGGCLDGFWLHDCSMACANPGGHCAGNNITCDQADGSGRVCSSGWAEGWWSSGATSSDALGAQPCTQGNCDGTVTCNGKDGTGRQCTACVAGFFGSDCTSPCVAANAHCIGVLSCDKDGANVKCQGRCEDGWHGD